MPPQSASPPRYTSLDPEQFRQLLALRSWLGKPTLLAVSGGVDSMVMAELYHQLKQPFAVAHINHGLRAQESDAESAFVEAWCMQRSIPFFSERLDLGPELKQGANLQKLAREYRYSLFERWRTNAQLELIATAHHLDDQIETVVFHAMRGSSSRALAGIPEQRGNIIRPLLNWDRASIEKFAKENAVDWRNDSSNTSFKYDRNKLRHELLPKLFALFPELKNRIIEESFQLRELNEELTPLIHAFWQRSLVTKEDLSFVSKEEILSFPQAEILLAELLRTIDLNPAQAKEVIALMKTQVGSRLEVGKYVFWNDRQELIIEDTSLKKEIKKISFQSLEELQDCTLFEHVRVIATEEVKFSREHDLAHISLTKLTWPLSISTAETGERFKPLGMKGNMLLSDFFTQRKYSNPAKERQLILRSENEIVWVLNDSISEHFKLSEGDEFCLEIKLKLS